jgi:hypothetical protein
VALSPKPHEFTQAPIHIGRPTKAGRPDIEGSEHCSKHNGHTPRCVLTYSVALVRKRTMPTERPLLVGEVSANFCRLDVYSPYKESAREQLPSGVNSTSRRVSAKKKIRRRRNLMKCRRHRDARVQFPMKETCTLDTGVSHWKGRNDGSSAGISAGADLRRSQCAILARNKS